MSVVYPIAVKNSRLSAVVTAIGATGVLEIGTTGMATILVSYNLNSPAGTVSNGILTFAGFPKTVAASAGGTPAAARIRTSTGGTDIITGLTVGTSGTDVVLDAASITAAQNVTVSGATITHA